ncbi:MAG: polysaccharide biosynthesis/export family protein [Pseudomonadota bacterium]
MRKISFLVCILLLASCASTGPANRTDESLVVFSDPTTLDADGKYKIGPGDVLTISVWGNPDLTSSVPVRPDGYISMPLIGDLLANDIDAATLGVTITTMLESQLRNPQVTVIVSQVNSNVYISRVRVTGAVRTPISIPFAKGMTVLDLILEAGGINEVATPSRTRLYRVVDNELVDVEINLDDILLRGQLATNYQLRPGDVITVPERLF